MGNKPQPRQKEESVNTSSSNNTKTIQNPIPEIKKINPNSFEGYCNNTNFIFYWKSNRNSNNKFESEIWELYDLNNQKHIKSAYLNYLQNPNKVKVKLLSPLDNFQIDFQLMHVYSWLESRFFMIKIEKIRNGSCNHLVSKNHKLNQKFSINNYQQSQLLEQDTEQFKLYWKSNHDPFDINQVTTWNAYDKTNQLYLNQKYKIFCEDNNEFNFNLLSSSKNYAVDFLKMHQFSLLDNWKIRPIKIEKLRNEIFVENLSLKKQLSHKLNTIKLSNWNLESLKDHENEDIQFFWNKKSDPFDYNQYDDWIPYTDKNQLDLNIRYKEFVKIIQKIYAIFSLQLIVMLSIFSI